MRDELIKKIFIATSIIVTIILVIGIYRLTFNSNHVSMIHDIREELSIENNKLSIRYIDGNMIDEDILYGNIYTKIIEIKNKNNIDLSYAIKLTESSFSNKYLSYSVYESDSLDNNSYTLVTKNSFFNNGTDLGYNFYVTKKSKKYVKIEFKSNYEEDITNIKGVIKVVANLTDKDIFISNTNRIISELNTKINNLNGINNPGLYIINIRELKIDDYYGYILIDAKDISDLKYVLSIYNNKLMVENLLYNNIEKKYITTYDDEKIKNLNDSLVCSNYSKKTCMPFSELTYNATGGRINFKESVDNILEKIRSTFNNQEKSVYVYSIKEDIDETSSLEGFILIDNSLENKEYYLYLHNYLFLISGYNITKYGDFTVDSNTIRAYNKTAFDLTNTKYKVCKFSGFSNCLDKSNNVISK